MKNATLIARILLGAAFLVFGINYYLKFLKFPPLEGLAKDFMGAIYQSGFLQVVKILEIVGGVLLLSKRFAPLGLTILGPILVNIALFDIFLLKAFNPLGTVLFVLWLFLMFTYRANFRGLFAPPKA